MSDFWYSGGRAEVRGVVQWRWVSGIVAVVLVQWWYFIFGNDGHIVESFLVMVHGVDGWRWSARFGGLGGGKW